MEPAPTVKRPGYPWNTGGLLGTIKRDSSSIIVINLTSINNLQ
jgi:hypothetical protein